MEPILKGTVQDKPVFPKGITGYNKDDLENLEGKKVDVEALSSQLN